MAVAPQYASETADGSGDAVFMFPDVPQGQLWIGTVTIPTAPASAVGTVNVGGSPVGPLFGPGIYGPYIADYSRRLSLTITGLMPDTQYQAVWHADDEGEKYSTWPGTVTTTVEGTVVIPVPVEIQGTVTALQGDPPWAVDGTVTADQGTPGSAADSWPVKVTDGTNVLGTPAHPLTVENASGLPLDTYQVGGSLKVNASIGGGTADLLAAPATGFCYRIHTVGCIAGTAFTFLDGATGIIAFVPASSAQPTLPLGGQIVLGALEVTNAGAAATCFATYDIIPVQTLQ